MSSARSASEESAANVATALRSAPFVRVTASADGDALAASGLLARALRTHSVPFQVRIRATPEPPLADETDLTVRIGADGGDVTVSGDETPATVEAYAIASELASDPGVEFDPDPVLALAGVVAANAHPGQGASAEILEAAESRGLVRRRPGVALPTDDVVTGLTHSTLVHAPFSGDVGAVESIRSELGLTESGLDGEDRRRLASWVAIETATAAGASPRAAESVERALHPYATPDGPFETVGGYADVLDAVARERPGTGVALALRDAPAELRADALDVWKEHARAVHAELMGATTGRYDGLFVARVDSGTPERLATAARLLRDFRSPEPVALVVTEGAAAASSVASRELGRVVDEAASAIDGTGYGRHRHAQAQFDDELEVSNFITAFREAL